jgi:hypothetical protein
VWLEAAESTTQSVTGVGGELHGAEGVDEVLWIPLP